MSSSDSDCIVKDHKVATVCDSPESSDDASVNKKAPTTKTLASRGPDAKAAAKTARAAKAAEARAAKAAAKAAKGGGSSSDEGGGKGSKKKYAGFDKIEDRNEMIRLFREAIEFLEKKMKDHQDWPFPGEHVSYEVVSPGTGNDGPTLYLHYNPVESDEEGDDELSTAPKKKAGGKKRRAAMKSPDSFTATFKLKYRGGKTGEWGIHAIVSPAANLKHLLPVEDINDITTSAGARNMQVRAAKEVGKKNIRIANATKFVRLALPHFVGEQVGRYIYQVELFGGKSIRAQPYMKAFFNADRIRAFVGFVSRLALPESDLEWNINVGPDEIDTAKDYGSESEEGSGSEAQGAGAESQGAGAKDSGSESEDSEDSKDSDSQDSDSE